MAESPDIQASVAENASWDSNPLMIVHDAKGLYGSSLTPTLDVTDKTPTAQVAAEASVTDNRFNQSNFDSTDPHAKITLARQFELWETGLTGTVDYDTARTSELTTLGLNTGSVRHTGYSLTPDVAYNLTGLDKLVLSGSYAKSAYDSPLLTNYEIFTLTPTYTHKCTELTQGVLSLQAQRYQSLAAPNARVDSLGPSVGFVASLTPRLTAQLSGGAQASQQSADDLAAQQWQWSAIYAGDLSYKGDQDVTSLSATRANQPYANGTESLLTSLSARESHKLNPMLSLDLNASYQFADQPPDSESNLKALWDGSAGFSYAITERWAATASDEYRYETLTDGSGTAKENIAKIGLTFRPDIGG